MASHETSLVARLIDRVSGPAAQAARSLSQIGRAASAANAMGGAHVGALTAQFQATAAAASRTLQQIRTNAATASATFSAPAMLAGAYAARQAFEFEKAGNMLEALGDTIRAQRAEFEQFANVLNQKYPQSLGEIIRTGNELLKAGLNYKQMVGAIDQTLATAILGEMKPSEVATMISSALNAFQMPKETTEQAIASTSKIADRMTYAAVKSTASLRDMGEMFKYVAGAAAATGSTIDDVTAMALAFSANKVNGSEAGVALRSAIVRLATGLTKDGRAAMERASLNLSDYMQGKQKITTDRIGSGLLAGGIDIAPIRGQIDALLADPTLATAPMKLAAKVTQLVQEQLTRTGSAMDAGAIAENVQDSIVAAGSKINLMKFFEDLKQKVASGSATMGDVAKILEGRHFARYQALFQADLAKLKQQIEAEAGGYTQSRYKIAIQGIVGAVYEFTAALEKLSVAFGRAVFPQAAAGLTSISNAVDRLSQSNPAMLRFAAYTAGALAVMGPLGLLMKGTAAAVLMFSGALKLLALSSKLAALGLMRLAGTMLVAPIIAGATALASTLAGLRTAMIGFAAAAAITGTRGALAIMAASLLRLLNPLRLVTAAAVVAKGALLFSGIGAVIVGIGVAAAFIARNLNGMAAGAKAFGVAFMAALGPAKPIVEPIISTIGTLWNWLAKITGELDAATWVRWGTAAGEWLGTIVRQVVELGQKIATAFSDVVSWGANLKDKGAEAITSLWEGMKERFSTAVEWLKSLPGQIIEAIGQIDLAEIGKSAIASLWKGMQSGASKLGSMIKGLVTGAPTLDASAADTPTLDTPTLSAPISKAPAPNVLAPNAPAAPANNNLSPKASVIEKRFIERQIFEKPLLEKQPPTAPPPVEQRPTSPRIRNSSLESLRTQAALIDQRLADIRANSEIDVKMNVDTSALEVLKARIAEQIAVIESNLARIETSAETAGTSLKDLGAMSIAPKVDGSPLQRFMTLIGQARSALSTLGSTSSAPAAAAARAGTAASTAASPAIAGARAAGGPVSAGKNYIVGEKGPEIFTPGTTGKITPANEMSPRAAVGSESGGKGTKSIDFAPTINVTVNGNGDSAEIENRIRRLMREEVRSLFRGAYADTGLRTA